VGKFLGWTGHQKAIGFGYALFMLGCMIVFFAIRGWSTTLGPLTLMDRVRTVAALIGVAFFISSFIGLCVFVRCPRCRTRLVWHAVSKDAHPRGLNALLLATRCPFCGFPAATEPAVERQ
jgi:hypothetical protein